MVLKWLVVFLIIVSICSCKWRKKSERLETSPYLSVLNADSPLVDSNFNSFIDNFSKDSIFQLSRTKFPLRVEQFNSESLKDTVIYLKKSSFEMMDFRKEKKDSGYDQWKRDIVLDSADTKATIEIRGIDNGIYIDYYFQKENGKWVFISINDGST